MHQRGAAFEPARYGARAKCGDLVWAEVGKEGLPWTRVRRNHGAPSPSMAPRMAERGKNSAEIRIPSAPNRVEGDAGRTYVAPCIPSTSAHRLTATRSTHRRPSMKAKQKIRALRSLAIAGSLSALIVPTAAVARPATEIPVRAENSAVAQQPFQLPAKFRTEVHTVGQPYSLPSG